MQLSEKLLFPAGEGSNLDSSLNGTPAKGAYNTIQFVLRLRDDIRSALHQENISEEKIQAASTHLHETIHWWQHIGSNFGFLFSLSYPAFAIFQIDDLKKLIEQNILYKSLIKYDRINYEKFGQNSNSQINFILNNYHDIEYARRFAYDNKLLSSIKQDNRFFLNIGHSYHIFWEHVICLLGNIIDSEKKILSNVDSWENKFKELTDNRVDGFYIDSPLSYASRLGIRAIYEGQAIFNQMQYLTVGLDSDLTYIDFEDIGMLHGIYLEAFNRFLEITQFFRPQNMLDPIVGLFLLVCDISINPTNGFPLDIYDYEGFIKKNDPGIRFESLCKAIAENPNLYLSILRSYSKEEYIVLSKLLSESIGCKCSYESISQVLKWSEGDDIAPILAEETNFNYKNVNSATRLLFSKYYRFQEDKYQHPNVFCWLGFHSTTANPNIDLTIVEALFKKHQALFVDDYDGEIKPVIIEGCKEENIQQSFDLFYQSIILFDLINKWVYEDGDFNYNYSWLMNKGPEETISYVHSIFKSCFHFPMDKIKGI